MSQSQRMCFYVPNDSYVEGQGYRVSVVKEGEAGHYPTGNWPYNGRVGETMPYFWGHDYDKACKIADAQNAHLGLSKEDVDAIVGSSMSAPRRGRRRAP